MSQAVSSRDRTQHILSIVIRSLLSATLCTITTTLHAGEEFQLVNDFAPGTEQDELFPVFYDDTGSVILAGRTLFRGQDGAHGYELWASNGTALGTELLVDLAPRPWNGLRESQFPVLDGFAYFVVLNQASQRELWRTDGTVQGTERFLDRVGVGDEVVVANELVCFTG